MACFHRPLSSLVPRLSTSLVEMKSANMNKFHGKKQHNIFNCTVVLSSWCYTLNIVNFLNDRKEVPEREGLGTTAFLSSLELSQVETIFFPPDSWNQLDRHDEPFGLPGLQVSFHRKPPNSVITSTCCCCKALSFHHLIPFQFIVWGNHRGHHRLTHGAAQPHVCAPRRPGQSGPDEVPATSCMWDKAYI